MNIPSLAKAAIEALKEHGYAVVVYSPTELEGADPQYVERVLNQAGWDYINTHSLRDYRVTYFEEDDSECLLFDCQATDVNHVVEQFEDAHPNGRIMAIEVRE